MSAVNPIEAQYRMTSHELSAMAARGRKVLSLLRDEAHAPSKTKQPVTWTISQAARLVGRSKNTLIAAEQVLPNMPGRRRDSPQSRRLYEMSDLLRLMEHFGTRPKMSRCRWVTVHGYKGGIGKTFTSTLLAHYFARRGYRTAILDLDPQGSCTQLISGKLPDKDIQVNQTLAPVFTGQATYLEPHNLMPTNWANLSLVPANLGLLDADYEARGNDRSSVDMLADAMRPLEGDLDIIVVDTPPTLSYLSICPMIASHLMVVPLPPRMADLASTISYLDMLANAAGRGLEVPTTRLAINMVSQERRISLHIPERADNLEWQFVDSVRAIYGDWVLRGEMLTSTVVQHLATQYRTLYEASSHDQAWRRAIRGPQAIAEQVEELLIAIDRASQGQE